MSSHLKKQPGCIRPDCQQRGLEQRTGTAEMVSRMSGVGHWTRPGDENGEDLPLFLRFMQDYLPGAEQQGGDILSTISNGVRLR